MRSVALKQRLERGKGTSQVATWEQHSEQRKHGCTGPERAARGRRQGRNGGTDGEMVGDKNQKSDRCVRRGSGKSQRA